ncbi:MAG: hypothetical protein OXC55_04050 [Chloroflexi bacterium]|nr:hypothetical protein [Chloroflexota bacterium]
MSQRFSRRLGPLRNSPAITVRNEAPAGLRQAVYAIAMKHERDLLKLSKQVLSDINYGTDRFPPNKVDVEHALVRGYLQRCTWAEVYDIIEFFYERLTPFVSGEGRRAYAKEINEYMLLNGIGYQLIDGRIEHRGDDASEQAVRQALAKTEQSGLDSAYRELSEALEDLSKRPQPDLTGAISHSMSALEIVAREVADDRNATLGKIIKDNPDMFPKPLDQAVEKMWGYASQYGRHVSAGKEPTYDEAELVVHAAAAAATYLVRKSGLIDGDTP